MKPNSKKVFISQIKECQLPEGYARPKSGRPTSKPKEKKAVSIQQDEDAHEHKEQTNFPQEQRIKVSGRKPPHTQKQRVVSPKKQISPSKIRPSRSPSVKSRTPTKTKAPPQKKQPLNQKSPGKTSRPVSNTSLPKGEKKTSRPTTAKKKEQSSHRKIVPQEKSKKKLEKVVVDQTLDLNNYNTVTQIQDDDDTKHCVQEFTTKIHSSYKQGYDYEELKNIKSHMMTSTKKPGMTNDQEVVQKEQFINHDPAHHINAESEAGEALDPLEKQPVLKPFQDLETLHKVQFEALLKFHQTQDKQLMAQQTGGPNQELSMQQCAMQFEQLQQFQRVQYKQHQQKQKMQFEYLMNQRTDAGHQLQHLLGQTAFQGSAADGSPVQFHYEPA